MRLFNRGCTVSRKYQRLSLPSLTMGQNSRSRLLSSHPSTFTKVNTSSTLKIPPALRQSNGPTYLSSLKTTSCSMPLNQWCIAKRIGRDWGPCWSPKISSKGDLGTVTSSLPSRPSFRITLNWSTGCLCCRKTPPTYLESGCLLMGSGGAVSLTAVSASTNTAPSAELSPTAKIFG